MSKTERLRLLPMVRDDGRIVYMLPNDGRHYEIIPPIDPTKWRIIDAYIDVQRGER